MDLYWYRYSILEDHKDAVAFPGLETWRSIYKAFPFILNDRHGIVRPPIRILGPPHSEFPDPNLHPRKTFEECCLDRASELLALSEATGKQLYILFSGGIDSTTVASSFLLSAPIERLRDRIKIVTSTESWIENPHFVRTHLISKFEFLSARSANRFYDGRALLVTGELNEYYVSNSVFNRISVHAGMADAISAHYSADLLICYMQACGMTEYDAKIWCEIFEQDRVRAIVPIQTLAEMLWWIRYNWTWQYCMFESVMSMNTLGPHIENFSEFDAWNHHFFGSPSFQIWSMFNTDRSSRKHACREVIRKFTHDDDWVRTKKKFYSLISILRDRKLATAITEKFDMLYTSEDVLRFYDPNNDFRG